MVARQPEDETEPVLTEVQERAAEVTDVLVAADKDPDPEDGDEFDERVDLVRTGLVRIRIAGSRFRLRRPFFGELKKLRLALQDVNDEISDLSDEALRLAREMTDAAKSDVVQNLDADEFTEWRRDNRKRSNKASRDLTDMTEDLRLGWWETMWDLLSVDGRPDDWPSWVVDPTFHAALFTHWRASPLGRG